MICRDIGYDIKDIFWNTLREMINDEIIDKKRAQKCLPGIETTPSLLTKECVVFNDLLPPFPPSFL